MEFTRDAGTFGLLRRDQLTRQVPNLLSVTPFRNAPSLFRRSSTSAAMSINGREIAIRNICSDNTFSAGDCETNGPRPAIAFERDRNATIRRDKHNPPGPNRTAAHSRNGSGV